MAEFSGSLGSVRLVVVPRTGRTMIERDRVSLLFSSTDAVERWYQRFFARAVSQTIVAEGLSVVLPKSTEDPDVLLTRYQEFLNLPGDVLDLWFDLLSRADRPVNDSRFLPPEKLAELDPKVLPVEPKSE